MFITGPDVVKTVTGEDVTFESSAARRRTRQSGVAHFVAPTTRSVPRGRRALCSRTCRRTIVEKPPSRGARRPADREDAGSTRSSRRIRTSRTTSRTSSGASSTTAISSRCTRAGRENIVCGFARLGGHVVGVVANQPSVLAGVLDIDSSDKAARFVRFCDAFNIPLVTFVDVPGFLPGTAQEYGGIIRHGAKLLYAYAEATVPKLTVITRKAYGGAYDVMSSKHIRADFNFAWPTAEIAVMGAGGRGEDRSSGASSRRPPTRRRARAELVAEYTERFANPYIAAERGYVDDVIEPRRTRPVLIDALETALTKTEPRPRRKHGNIPL